MHQKLDNILGWDFSNHHEIKMLCEPKNSRISEPVRISSKDSKD